MLLWTHCTREAAMNRLRKLLPRFLRHAFAPPRTSVTLPM